MRASYQSKNLIPLKVTLELVGFLGMPFCMPSLHELPIKLFETPIDGGSPFAQKSRHTRSPLRFGAVKKRRTTIPAVRSKRTTFKFAITVFTFARPARKGWETGW